MGEQFSVSCGRAGQPATTQYKTKTAKFVARLAVKAEVHGGSPHQQTNEGRCWSSMPLKLLEYNTVPCLVHVGAHSGEEVDEYRRRGFDPIICFEPNPAIFVSLLGLGVEAYPVALSNKAGFARLRIPANLDGTDNTQSASLFHLDPAAAVNIGWTPTEARSIIVPTARFDDFADLRGISPDVLVIDVQGHEWEVLKGFGKYLSTVTEATIECSDPPLYTGGQPALVVVGYMVGFGLLPVTPILAHGDIAFKRTVAQ